MPVRLALAAPPSAAPPRFDHWPPALRSAERLRGTLVRCGPGLRGIGWPESPRVRATAIAPWLEDGFIATHLTAAWVWGAAREPGRPLRIAPFGRRRHNRVSTELLRIAEMRYVEAEVHRFGEMGVTAPLRTAVDLLHDRERFGRIERVACRLLIATIPGGAAAAAASIASRRRPARCLALNRLQRFAGAAALQGRDVTAPAPTRETA